MHQHQLKHLERTDKGNSVLESVTMDVMFICVIIHPGTSTNAKNQRAAPISGGDGPLMAHTSALSFEGVLWSV